jgi:CrcB protein
MPHVERLLWICFGSALGGGARYLLSSWVTGFLGPSFAYGTLSVNVLGSFLMGGLMYAGVEAAGVSPELRIVLTTGVMGGFTTYSTFSYETFAYLKEGAWHTGILNALVTLLGCLVATLLGWLLAKWLFVA